MCTLSDQTAAHHHSFKIINTYNILKFYSVCKSLHAAGADKLNAFFPNSVWTLGTANSEMPSNQTLCFTHFKFKREDKLMGSLQSICKYTHTND